MILYLHGFRSSPESFKARLLAEALKARGHEHDWVCPQLPASPARAMALADGLVHQAFAGDAERAAGGLCVVGSSLGGYYALCLAARWGCRAVVLNPVIHAARDLATQVGEHTLYHGEGHFTFRPEYVQELADMAAPRPKHPERILLVAATGDEVLDWRDMTDWLRGCHQHIVTGGDHGLSGFADQLPEVLDFILAPAGTRA